MPDTPTTPEEYIAALPEGRREELGRLDEIVREAAPELEPHIESGMLGYGTYHYRYASGREGDAAVVGLASRKQYISMYVCPTEEKYAAERYADALPKANIGKGCIRFKRLSDVDEDTLAQVVRDAAATHA